MLLMKSFLPALLLLFSVSGQAASLQKEPYSPKRFEQLQASGQVILIDIYAPWCPTCQKADKNLTAAKGSLPTGLTVVKVDYDNSNDLRQKYGVTVQHTFVQVDADGNELAKWVGSYTPEEIQSQVA